MKKLLSNIRDKFSPKKQCEKIDEAYKKISLELEQAKERLTQAKEDLQITIARSEQSNDISACLKGEKQWSEIHLTNEDVESFIKSMYNEVQEALIAANIPHDTIQKTQNLVVDTLKKKLKTQNTHLH